MKKETSPFWNKIWRDIKKNWFQIIAIILISLFFLINYSTIINKLSITGEKGLIITQSIIYVAISIVLILLVWLMSRKIKEKDNNYQKIFIVLATILGIVYLFLSPLFTGSDEHNHYYRIYEITEGVIRTPVGENYSGGELPSSLVKTFGIGEPDNTKIKYTHNLEMTEISLNKEETMIYSSDNYATYYSNTSLYSPFSYIPHVIGFLIGKTINLGPYFIGMLGRLFNLIAYILIGYFAIKIMPKAKLFYLLVFLSPNMMQLATTLSADAFMNSVFLLLLAIIMKVRLGEKTISRREQVVVAGLSILIALCKIAYLPLTLFIFLIKGTQYKRGKREKYLYSTVVLIASVVCSLLWIKSTGRIFDAAYPQTELQKAFILSNPADYLVIFIRSVINNFVSSVECLFVGTKMYHTQLTIPAVVSFLYVGIVIIALFKKDDKQISTLTDIEKNIIVGINLIIIFLILTALYIQCTAQFVAVGNPVISGIQGRYFIPTVLCLPFIIIPQRFRNLNEKKIIVSILLISLTTWFYMMSQFII